MSTPPPPVRGTASGLPSSVQQLASLLGIPLNSTTDSQPANQSTTHALSQLLQLVQQQQAQRGAAAPAPQPPPQEQAWQQQQQQQQAWQPQAASQHEVHQQQPQQQAWQPQAASQHEVHQQQPQPQQQAWQPQAASQHEALLATLLQSAQQQQQQQPAPLAYQQPPPQQDYPSLLMAQMAQQNHVVQQVPPPPPLPAFQSQEGHSWPSGGDGAADGVAAGRKVRVSCNDVRGTLHIDSLYVACECRDCEGRVRLGHDRPIFGLSRWEKHCGSKAKKWRISLRVVPGSCPEVGRKDPPMAVGTWLDMKGITVSGTGERIGMDTEAPFAGIAAKRARLPTWGAEGGQGHADGMVERAGSPGTAATAAAADANEAQEPWELALLDGAAPGSSVSEAFLRQQQQVFAELRAGGGDAVTAQRQHTAIFGLAAALLDGPAQHLLSEAYLPYINDLSAEHLARQISTFGCYLDLLGQGMEWRAVHRQLMAFMRGTLRRILARRRHASEAGAEGEGGAADGAKPAASSPAPPTTAPSAGAVQQGHGLPASGSTPGMAEAAANAGNEVPVGSSSQGTGSVDRAARLQQPALAEAKREPELAAGGQAAAADGAGAGEAMAAAVASAATAQDAAAAGEGAAAEAAGSSGPAAVACKAELPERAAMRSGSAGGHQLEGLEQQAAAEQPVPADSEMVLV